MGRVWEAIKDEEQRGRGYGSAYGMLPSVPHYERNLGVVSGSCGYTGLLGLDLGRACCLVTLIYMWQKDLVLIQQFFQEKDMLS